MILLFIFVARDSSSLSLVQAFSTPYVKSNLALVAVDEAHCITDWLVTWDCA